MRNVFLNSMYYNFLTLRIIKKREIIFLAMQLVKFTIVEVAIDFNVQLRVEINSEGNKLEFDEYVNEDFIFFEGYVEHRELRMYN